MCSAFTVFYDFSAKMKINLLQVGDSSIRSMYRVFLQLIANLTVISS